MSPLSLLSHPRESGETAVANQRSDCGNHSNATQDARNVTRQARLISCLPRSQGYKRVVRKHQGNPYGCDDTPHLAKR